MNIFHAQFTTGQVVEATGVPNATLQSWMNRGHIVGQRETASVEGGGKAGKYRRFSFFNVMEITVAKALIDAGLGDVGAAFGAARRFAHTGQGPLLKDPERRPGCPFDIVGTSTLTLLCVRGERTAIVPWKIGKKEDVLSIIRHRLVAADGFVLIFINPIFEQVVFRLGYKAADVLSLAYDRKGTQE